MFKVICFCLKGDDRNVLVRCLHYEDIDLYLSCNTYGERVGTLVGVMADLNREREF